MMEKDVERALEKSILKWERNASVTDIDDAVVCARECPLCELFFFEKECVGCPVAERTGQIGCKGTSYRAAYDGKRAVKFFDKPLAAFLIPAEEYLDLLKSLRPPKPSTGVPMQPRKRTGPSGMVLFAAALMNSNR